jgi:penicillin-binding protein 1A
MGYDYPAEMTGIHGNPCVGIWDDLISLCEEAYGGAPLQKSFPVPPELISLEFCPLSGDLPNEFCTHPVGGHPTETGWFLLGSSPTDICSVHEEPPIPVRPADPSDPDRIPLFPEDLLPETEPLPHPRLYPREEGTRKRWFSRFFGG